MAASQSIPISANQDKASRIRSDDISSLLDRHHLTSLTATLEQEQGHRQRRLLVAKNRKMEAQEKYLEEKALAKMVFKNGNILFWENRPMSMTPVQLFNSEEESTTPSQQQIDQELAVQTLERFQDAKAHLKNSDRLLTDELKRQSREAAEQAKSIKLHLSATYKQARSQQRVVNGQNKAEMDRQFQSELQNEREYAAKMTRRLRAAGDVVEDGWTFEEVRKNWARMELWRKRKVQKKNFKLKANEDHQQLRQEFAQVKSMALALVKDDRQNGNEGTGSVAHQSGGRSRAATGLVDKLVTAVRKAFGVFGSRRTSGQNGGM